MAEFDKDGHQIPDPTPLEIPVGFHQPPDIMETIRKLVQLESGKAAGEGEETFEEADDFEVGESDQVLSGYQVHDMVEERPDLAKNLPPEKQIDPKEWEEFQAFKAFQQSRQKFDGEHKKDEPKKNSASDTSKSVVE